MSPCEVVAQGRQHQPREREQAQAPGEGFSQGHGNLRGGARWCEELPVTSSRVRWLLTVSWAYPQLAKPNHEGAEAMCFITRLPASRVHLAGILPPGEGAVFPAPRLVLQLRRASR